MNKSVVFSLLAMFCYALANVILEQKLSRFNNLTLMSVYVVPIFLVGIVGRWLTKTSDPSFDFPIGMDMLFLIAMGCIFAAADYFYIGAYTNKGNLFTIVCISVMFPVFAALMKFLWTQSLPNLWHASGYTLAVGAVLLVVKGNMVQQLPQ